MARDVSQDFDRKVLLEIGRWEREPREPGQRLQVDVLLERLELAEDARPDLLAALERLDRRRWIVAKSLRGDAMILDYIVWGITVEGGRESASGYSNVPRHVSTWQWFAGQPRWRQIGVAAGMLAALAAIVQITGISLRDVVGFAASHDQGPAAPRTSAQGPIQSGSVPAISDSPSAVQTTPGDLVPTLPPGPSTVATLAPGVTMRISVVIPGFFGPTNTVVRFQVNNTSGNDFILNFQATDVIVYDDQHNTYSVQHAVYNQGAIGAVSQGRDPEIWVNGTPATGAKRWTVTFKSLSGRTDVTMTYTF